jgi:DNA-binding transcriptional MerR regulator/effector-binding domain-containing protein
MFGIGDFAALGRVSVRMLRHYDALGLLTPARVDSSTGYRYYSADQLSRLNRIIALKDLGFTLEQVQTVLDEKVDVTELRGMLRLRRAQLQEHLAAESSRLTRIEARLRLIESEGNMSVEEVVIKSVPPVRVAELSAVAASYEAPDVGPVITPLYPELFKRLEQAGLSMTGAPLAYYDAAPDAPDGVVCHAAVPVGAVPPGDHGLAIVELPGIDQAATLIHHGPMETVDTTMQTLARWIEENGYSPAAGVYAREVYLSYDPKQPETGVTEMQLPVRRS